jgi:hypothetical protein
MEGEARIRSVQILIGPSSTWGIYASLVPFIYVLIFPSATSYLTLPLDPYPVRTRSTEVQQHVLLCLQ